MALTRRELMIRGAAALASTAVLGGRGWAAGDDRAGGLVTRLLDPYCAETRLARLARSWLTPIEDFFVLNHGDQPWVAAGEWRLAIEGRVRRPLRLGLAELGRLPEVTAAATLMCAGNRRREFDPDRLVGVVPRWGAGAVGNATWTGPRLRDVVALAGLADGARHVWFEGLDRTTLGRFGGSIPIERALAEDAPVLLAHRMNGRVLPRSHGHPLRVVVPGAIGARSVKWLTRVVVSDRPSTNPHFTTSHRGPGPDGPSDPTRAALQDVSLNAAFCSPGGPATIPAGPRRLCGYAIPPGRPGVRIARVELSVDGGRRWFAADLDEHDLPGCWRLWSADVDLRPGTHSLVARAIDSDGHRQPRRARWNPGGYLYDAWPRVTLDVAG